MAAVIDLTGQRFGRLLVQAREGRDAVGRALWRGHCDCGQVRRVLGANLRSGRTRSCGCFRREMPIAYHTTHGLLRGGHPTPEYQALRAARLRCTNPADKDFANYGGRGIEYRLLSDPGEAIAALVAAIGLRPPGMSIDRIDNEGHYEIGNLRWATRTQQRHNQRPATRGAA
jgi:hypothetical protein